MRKTEEADTPRVQKPSAHVYIDPDTFAELLLVQTRRQAPWIPAEYEKERHTATVLTDELAFGAGGGLHVTVLIEPTEEAE